MTAEVPYENPYMRKPKPKKTFWQHIYNKEKNRILGRTPQSFGRLLLFYLIFYACLAVFFLICLKGLMSTISDTEPKWKLDDSLIGTNPGLSFKPTPNYDQKLGMVIQYNASNPDDVEKWVKSIDAFVEPYVKATETCEKDTNKNIQIKETCIYETDNWGDCAPGSGYGYNQSSPCIFLKLNRIYDWEPEFYSDKSLPSEIPDIVKDFIDILPEDERDQIWVSCDRIGSNVTVDVVYHGFGFPGDFYPFKSSPGYLSPIVPIRFENMTGIVTIECRVWAKNIKYDSHKDNRQGSVRFKLDVQN